MLHQFYIYYVEFWKHLKIDLLTVIVLKLPFIRCMWIEVYVNITSSKDLLIGMEYNK